jgi:hypothetical protein
MFFLKRPLTSSNNNNDKGRQKNKTGKRRTSAPAPAPAPARKKKYVPYFNFVFNIFLDFLRAFARFSAKELKKCHKNF